MSEDELIKKYLHCVMPMNHKIVMFSMWTFDSIIHSWHMHGMVRNWFLFVMNRL